MSEGNVGLRWSEVATAVALSGFVVIAGGYAVERYVIPHPLTATLEAWPVRCTSQVDPTTCTRLGPDATTFTPQQMIEMQLTFNQPTDTQNATVHEDAADGSHGALQIAALSAVTAEPFLVMKGCDMGANQTLADNLFTLSYNGTAIGHGIVSIQSTDGRSSRTC